MATLIKLSDMNKDVEMWALMHYEFGLSRSQSYWLILNTGAKYSLFYWLEAKYITGVDYFAPEALLSTLNSHLWGVVTVAQIQ